MTREEAINIIKSECYVFNPLNFDRTTRINTALDVAVEALEQEPCEDAISRQAVIDMTGLSEWFDSSDSYDDFVIALSKLPPVTPTHTETVTEFDDRCIECGNRYGRLLKQATWIPVSERVAEFPCLACDIFEQIFIPCGIVVLDSRCYEGKDFAFNVEKFLRGKEVILCGGEKVYEKPREIVAWMPLPEPYKEESEGEE